MNDYRDIETNTVLVEILKNARPKQLQHCNPHVKKLVEDFANVNKVKFPSKPVAGKDAADYFFKEIERKKTEALAEWEGE